MFINKTQPLEGYKFLKTLSVFWSSTVSDLSSMEPIDNIISITQKDIIAHAIGNKEEVVIHLRESVEFRLNLTGLWDGRYVNPASGLTSDPFTVSPSSETFTPPHGFAQPDTVLYLVSQHTKNYE